MASVTVYGGAGEVGGNKILVEDGETRAFLDFGRSMGEAGKYYEEYIKVRAKSALLDLLKLGILPRIDGIYRKDLLDRTCLSAPGIDVREHLPMDDAGDYWVSDSPLPYDPANPYVQGVFVSHAHFDHIQDVSFLDPGIPVICSETTMVLARAITQISRGGVDLKFFEGDDMSKFRFMLKNPHFKTVFPGSLATETDSSIEEVLDHRSGHIFTMDKHTVQRSYLTAESGSLGTLTYRLIPVGHSVDGAVSVLLKTADEKRMLYTGDIRFHGRGETPIDEYVRMVGEGVDLMICEGTRVDSGKRITEEDVRASIMEQARRTEGLLLVDFGWKDTTRFDTVASVARETGRTFVISPKLAFLLFDLHVMDPDRYPDPREMPHVRVYKERCGELLYSDCEYEKYGAGYLHNWGRNSAKSDNNIARIAGKRAAGETLTPEEDEAWNLATNHIFNGIPAYEIRKNPGKYILMFSFWDANELMDLSTPDGRMPGAFYIRASCEPFNDEMEIDEGKLMNWLRKFGIAFEPETKPDGTVHFKRAHVSGHAARPELKELISKLKPRKLIPIHSPMSREFLTLAAEIEAETGHRMEVVIPDIGARYEV